MNIRKIRKIRNQLLLGLFCWAVLLVFYEASQKLHEWFHIEAPLWWAADEAEKGTKCQRRTGIHWIDRALHEAQEAGLFYDRATKEVPPDSATTVQEPCRTQEVGNGK